MKTWKKILLLVGVLLLAFGLTVLQIAHHRGEGFLIAPTKLGLSNVSGLSYDQKGYTVCSSGEERFAAKDVKSLDVDWLSGAADVERYDGREVVIRETAGARLTEDQCMRWKLKDGALSILPCANRVRELPEKRLSVLVPRDLTLESANVDVASASCSLRGIEADGKLSLGSASGSLAVEDCRCGELELDSASGSQSVLRTEVSGKTDADLASGSFTAEDLEAIEAEMKKVIKEGLAVSRFTLPRDEAVALMVVCALWHAHVLQWICSGDSAERGNQCDKAHCLLASGLVFADLDKSVVLSVDCDCDGFDVVFHNSLNLDC